MHNRIEHLPVTSEYVPGDDEAWHYDARLRLAKLAGIMSTTFVRRHDASQPDEYYDAYDKHRQLETDIQLYGTHGEYHDKSYTHVG